MNGLKRPSLNFSFVLGFIKFVRYEKEKKHI